MATKQKLGDRGGVSSWQALASPGDIRRFLRWCVLSVRNRSLATHEASCLGQLACHLLRAIELDGIEQRLARLEAHDQSLGQVPVEVLQ